MSQSRQQKTHPRTQTIALTMGDPAGIGLDITLRAWADRNTNDIPAFTFYANANTTVKRAKALGIDAPISRIASPALAPAIFKDAIPLIDIPLQAEPVIGQPDTRNGEAVIRSIDQAVADTRDHLTHAVVTNPISKATLYDTGFAFPGHTEYLGHLAAQFAKDDTTKPVMMIACDELRVVPLTIHIPLRDIPGAISESLIIDTARTVSSALENDFTIKSPRLAITGLNPHAGENDALGDEESKIIKPAIEQLRELGLNVTGPHPADTIFHSAARKTYDAAIAMYHDQALIPIKTLAFDKGVNVTLGLPFIRTSPDHGTAFDIAGTGTASPDSLIESLLMAAKIARTRNTHNLQTTT